MGLRATTRRLAAGAAALLVTVVAFAPGPATAQVDCVAEPADPACVPDETSTTVDGAATDATTTTTEAEPERTTTTARRTTTTETPDDVPVAEQDDEEVVDEPITTLPERPTLLVPGPPLVEPASVAPEVAQQERPDPAGEPLDTDPSSSPGDDDRTRRTVTLAIAGLLTAAVLLGGLTWWYWRRTRPTEPATPMATTPTTDPPAADPPVDDADDVDGSAPTGAGTALGPEDADWHEEQVRPPMAAPPGRVTDRAR